MARFEQSSKDRRAFERYVKASDGTQALTKKVAARLLEYAKQECPVDSGRLQASGHLEDSDVVFQTAYLMYVLYGTRNQQANNFMLRALNRLALESR